MLVADTKLFEFDRQAVHFYSTLLGLLKRSGVLV